MYLDKKMFKILIFNFQQNFFKFILQDTQKIIYNPQNSHEFKETIKGIDKFLNDNSQSQKEFDTFYQQVIISEYMKKREKSENLRQTGDQANSLNLLLLCYELLDCLLLNKVFPYQVEAQHYKDGQGKVHNTIQHFDFKMYNQMVSQHNFESLRGLCEQRFDIIS